MYDFSQRIAVVTGAGKGIGNIPKILENYAAIGGGIITLEPHLYEFVGLAGLEREGEESAVGEIKFSSNEEAFDYACTTFKSLLEG